MNKKGFTLIELLAVIVIIGSISVMMIVKVDKNIKDAKALEEKNKISVIESAAELYAINYTDELTTLASTNVERVALSVLVNKGILKESSITGISQTNTVMIANINSNIKVKYDPLYSNVIFINGVDTVTVKRGSTYTDMGASVAMPGTGIVALTVSNTLSTVDTSTVGTYTVTYNYTNAANAIRTVKVI